MTEDGQIFNLVLACVSACTMILVSISGVIHLSQAGAGVVGLILCVSSFHLGGMIRGREICGKHKRRTGPDAGEDRFMDAEEGERNCR
jgi:hypothetical protein